MSKRAYTLAGLCAAALIVIAALALGPYGDAKVGLSKNPLGVGELAPATNVNRLGGESGEDAAPALEVVRLGRELAHERARLARLEGEVRDLSERLEGLTAAGADRANVPLEEPGQDREEGGAEPKERVAWFDSEVVVAAGFPRDEVERFRSRLDGIALEELYLRDQAAREGWLGTPRFHADGRELSSARKGTRAEFGDDLYDWMLYTTGQRNRVRVNEVIAGSVAADAGLQSDDIVLSYGETRIFDTGQLRDGTTAGNPGELTPVDVLRNGEEVRVYVPRGPLGVRMQALSREPAAR